jgi:hypothetical protein
MEGDIYFGGNEQEAKTMFAGLKKKSKKVDGVSGDPSHVLYVDGKIIDLF